MRELRDIIANALPNAGGHCTYGYCRVPPVLGEFDRLVAADDIIWAMKQAGYEWSKRNGTGGHTSTSRHAGPGEQELVQGAEVSAAHSPVGDDARGHRRQRA